MCHAFAPADCSVPGRRRRAGGSASSHRLHIGFANERRQRARRNGGDQHWARQHVKPHRQHSGKPRRVGRHRTDP